MSDVLKERIEETKALVGGLISKPKMSDKLLKRPPFRFLHDTIMAINNKVHFVDDLYSDSEKDSSTITDKPGKVAFLEKIIGFAGICAGEAIDVRAGKVVAGAEAENTNMLLQAIARAASDATIDYSAAAKDALDGVKPGSIPRIGGGESKADEDEAKESESKSDVAAAAAAADEEARVAAEKKRRAKEKRESERREEQERQAREEQQREAASPGGSADGEEKTSSGGGLDLSKVDGAPETTIELYNGMIRKPKLNTKLLGKPPFRFLHDIVSNLSSAHGDFLQGLFQGEELDARQCSTKELKIGYLDKLIAFVSICTESPVEARSSRIVSGHEFALTNKLLQKLVIIAQNVSSIPTGEAIQHALNGTTPDRSGTAAAASSPPAKREKRHSDSSRKKEQPRQEEEAGNPEPAPKREEKADDDEAKDSEDRQEIAAPASDRKPAGRPQTARKRPPKIREKATEVNAKDTSVGQPVGVMMDGQDDSDEDSDMENPEDVNIRSRNEGSNPALDGGDLKSKLVRDILDDEQKSEQKREEGGDEEAKSSDAPVTSGITMGKIGQGIRRGSKGTSVGAVEVDKIRSAIQLLCQSTNPLGKCMDYVHEDLSVMSKELEKWRSHYRKNCDQLEDEQRVTTETLLPLRGKLSDVEERIQDEQAKLSTLKASIAKNDQRIAELLRDMVLN